MWRFTLALVTAGLITGCAQGLSPEQIQPWVGRPATELSKSWGPPTREVMDEGLRVLIYEELDHQTKTSFAPAEGTREARQAGRYLNPYQGPQVYARSYLFWVDAKGAIVRAERRQP